MEEHIKKKILSIGIGTLAVTLVIGLLFLTTTVKYNSAMKLYEDKNYSKASNLFLQLGAFKDAKNMYNNAQSGLANECVKNKAYEDAIHIYQKIDMNAENAASLENAWLLLASQCFDNGDYERTLHILKEIENSENLSKDVANITYNVAIEKFDGGDYDGALTVLSSIKDRTDMNANIANMKYKIAVKLYNDGFFLESKKIFASIENIEDSGEYLQKLSVLAKLQGTWTNGYYEQLVFRGWNIYFVRNTVFLNKNVAKYQYEVNDDTVTFGHYEPFVFSNNKLIQSKGAEFIYLNSDNEIPCSSPSPEIGMTAQEVEKSNWGKPNKINKTTNSYGISEQWVYSEHRYVYLDDGVVTSIQN